MCRGGRAHSIHGRTMNDLLLDSDYCAMVECNEWNLKCNWQTMAEKSRFSTGKPSPRTIKIHLSAPKNRLNAWIQPKHTKYSQNKLVLSATKRSKVSAKLICTKQIGQIPLIQSMRITSHLSLTACTLFYIHTIYTYAL